MNEHSREHAREDSRRTQESAQERFLSARHLTPGTNLMQRMSISKRNLISVSQRIRDVSGQSLSIIGGATQILLSKRACQELGIISHFPLIGAHKPQKHILQLIPYIIYTNTKLCILLCKPFIQLRLLIKTKMTSLVLL